MIQGFRKLFQSPLGLALTLGFVVLIALAFASADITGSGFGGIAGGERVATVGDQRISTSQLRSTVNGAYDSARDENPNLAMADYLAAGATEQLLDQMIERAAIYEFGHDNGIRIGESLIGSELTQFPAFQGPDGKFSEEVYRTALSRRGLNEKLVREDIGQGLVTRMLMVPATSGDALPTGIARRYAMLLNERRQGGVALIPSMAFAAEGPVAKPVLEKYLAANRDRYSLPERRSIRFVRFDKSVLSADVAATDAEIAARYKQDEAKYRGREDREIEQLVLPTEAAAKAVLAEIGSPDRIGAVANEKGLSTNRSVAAGQQALAAQSNSAVAAAVYNGKAGTIVGPVRGPLGYYLVRIVKVTAVPGRSLAEVRDEIAREITNQKTDRALADRAAALEQQLAGGTGLADIAKSLGAKVETSAMLLEDGRTFPAGEQSDPALARLVPAVFAMLADSDPQIAAGPDGESYVIFAPGKIARAAPPPLAEIEERLTRDYKLEQGEKQAAAAADKVLKAMAGGKTLAQAMAAIEIKAPPVDRIDLSRQQLMGNREQRVPPALALMFNMAPDTAKKLQAPQNVGWFVVALDKIEVPEVDADDPMVVATRRELSRIRANELMAQLRTAIRGEVSVTRNESAIALVNKQLSEGAR